MSDRRNPDGPGYFRKQYPFRLPRFLRAANVGLIALTALLATTTPYLSRKANSDHEVGRIDFSLFNKLGERLSEPPKPWLARIKVHGRDNRMAELLGVLDGGASDTILPRELRAPLHIRDRGKQRIVGVGGKAFTVHWGYVEEIEIGNSKFEHVEVLLYTHPSHYGVIPEGPKGEVMLVGRNILQLPDDWILKFKAWQPGGKGKYWK